MPRAAPDPRRVVLAPCAMLATLATSACAPIVGGHGAGGPLPGLTEGRAIRVGNRQRFFLLHLPPARAYGRPLPVVLVFHGHGGNGAIVMHASRMNEEADRRGFAVVYPNGTTTGHLPYAGLTWNVRTCCDAAADDRVDDVAFVDSIVAVLARDSLIDPARVYAAGFSAGGMLALRLACERASEFAGAADVAGSMPDVACDPARAVPVLIFQGERDDELRTDLVELRVPGGRAFATSMSAAFDFWATRNGCAAERVDDSTAAFVRVAADGCGRGREVELYTVRGNPHAWPGGARTWPLAPLPAQGVSASAVILDFFLENAPASTAHGTPGRD